MPLIEDEFEDALAIVRRRGPEFLIARHSGSDDLPRVRTVGHHPADVTPIRTAVRDRLGLETVVLDCRDVSVADGVVRRLLVLESIEAGSGATDLTWVVPDELPQHAPPRDGRDWTVPGWWARAAAWITQKVQAARLGRVVALEQLRAWEFSCVLRVRTDLEDLYFKALPRSHAGEPRLAEFLAHSHPRFVPGVLAINQRERWLLMRACHGQCLEAGAPPSAWERAAAGCAELQVASSAHLQTLEARGCPVGGPLELRSLVGPLLADETALLGPGEYGLSTQELRRLQQLQPAFEAACDELADSDLPLALEHGDLWSSNVYVSDTDVQFIDWTEASIAHPFFSLMPLLESAGWDRDPATLPALQARVIDRYLEHWLPWAPPERLRRALAMARPLAALHIAATYWRDTPQPHLQWWMPRMVPFFVRMALEEWHALEEA